VARIGRYEILRRIGQGGMGEVFAAIDPTSGQQVAIKRLLLPPSTHPSVQEELIVRAGRELRALQALQGHPHIIEVLDAVPEEHAIVTEYLDGRTFDDILETDGALPVDWALLQFRQIVDAVGFAHARGILHRDIKPGNVMLVDRKPVQVVKVLDFGLARLADQRRLTRIGQAMGTPWFMAPEQHLGAQVDERTDIYALGLVLYTLIAGEPPFARTAGTEFSLADAHVRQPLPPWARPDVPAWVDQVIRRATEKQPHRRYQSCAELERDLPPLPQARQAPRPAPAEPDAPGQVALKPSVRRTLLHPGPGGQAMGIGLMVARLAAVSVVLASLETQRGPALLGGALAVLLACGLGTRVAALAALAVVLVLPTSSPALRVTALPLLLVLAVLGPGRFSIDNRVAHP